MRRNLSESYLEYSKNFPHLNTFWLPEDLGKYGMPLIPRTSLIPDELWPYDERKKSDEYEKDLPKNVAIHFFLTDHWFNGVWTYANRTLGSIRRFDCAISPDFSLYRDWPIIMQMWNTYRSRWLGAWWNHNGINVIPSVNWSTEESYEFCFEGLPIGGTFAIATMEINDKDSLGSYLFLQGFKEMLDRCQPGLVLVYGQGFSGVLENMANVKRFPHRLTHILSNER